ncbi:tripartite tricarboxylate transporter substrate binding protein [Delftia acidovorans]|uniref:Tripartite tricarboxylate transporter substrate binding protein n=1 Tax=Delftia acidovorans TaxID=80866 RepID=A0A7T2S285_DELAC|nr:tripartite tricarboxylate transporter substrate binding protein [Delftia acidovorans]QPS07621.1 tripartite tricarboxylate transporter substrate binding protein [Delftia acidovorans]
MKTIDSSCHAGSATMRRPVPGVALPWRFSALAALALCMPFAAASGQDYPNKPIRIIIGFAPGSSGDVQVRLVARKLTEAWGQPIIIESKPGASGSIAAGMLVRAAPDGYTLLYFPAALAVNPSLFPKLPYDLARDFSPVALLSKFPLVMAVTSTLPARSVAEVIRLAKAKPGSLSYASLGNASPPHLAGELFNQIAEVKLVHVPYKGSGLAQSDLISGHVQVMFDTAVATTPHAAAGRTRALAVTTRQRSSLLPELPTLHESGLPGYDLYGWGGIVAPAGVAPEIISKLNTEIAKALGDPGVAHRLASLGAETAVMSPLEFGAFIQDEAAKWKDLVLRTGARLD